MAAVTIEALEKKKLDLHEHMSTLMATADAEGRELNEEEQKAWSEAQSQFKAVERDIQNRRELAAQSEALQAVQPRRTKPDVDSSTSVTDPPRKGSGVTASMLPKGQWGWHTFGHFCNAVRQHAHGHTDQRLTIANAAASTYSSEAAQADGGFAVPPDFRAAIVKKIMGADSLLARTDQQTTSTSAVTFPTDETTPWQTSGGIQVAWEVEAAAAAQSKVALGELSAKAYKLRALVPATSELLQDANSFSNWLNSKVPDKFNFAITNAIINGTGVGQPQGLMGAACKVTVSKESGQASGTVLPANITKMWGRCLGDWRPESVWIINQDVEQQLQQFVMGGTTAATPVYLPPGGLSASPYATLMGRPVIVTEACKALSTEGDIILTNLRQYLTVVRTGGVQQDVSVHLWFDQDLVAFKFWLRLGGQPWWNSAITRLNGSSTLSSIVTLQTR